MSRAPRLRVLLPPFVAVALAAAGLLALGARAAGSGGGNALAADGGSPADAAPPRRNDAGEELPELVTIVVGGHAALRLGWVCIEARCDDRSVVGVEDGGDHLRLRGRAVGRTLCGFWRERRPTPNRLIEVQVVPRPTPPTRRRDGGAR